MDPTRITKVVASKKSGPDDMINEPTMRKPIVAKMLQIRVHRASQSRKQTGRYFPLQSFRAITMAVSIPNVMKANTAKKRVVSFENSVEYDKVPKPATRTTVTNDSRNRMNPPLLLK